MLSGVFLMLFGIGFLFQSLSLVIIYMPLFMVISFLEFRMIEEPELEKRLGTPMWNTGRESPCFSHIQAMASIDAHQRMLY